MNATNLIRNGALAATIGLAGLIAATASAHDIQPYGRSSVYADAKSIGTPKPFDGVTVAGNGRGSVYAVGRVTPRDVAVALPAQTSPARTVPGNGRGSVYAWTNDSWQG